MPKVETIRTTELGDRSYVAHDGASAIVIDPQRDIDRVQAILDELGLACVLSRSKVSESPPERRSVEPAEHS